jgi:hypothetical protein
MGNKKGYFEGIFILFKFNLKSNCLHMRKLVLLSILFISSLGAFAQSDTLFVAGKNKIPCKIYEINEFEIKYRRAEAPDGPIYVIDKSTVTRYTLSTGFSEFLKPDEMSLENEHKEILGNRQVVKVQPFGVAFGHFTMAYEKVIKVGMNLDAEAGYINSDMSPNQGTFLSGRVSQNPFYSGAYIKPGIKFFLGQDFNVKGLRYAHPLKGRYIKLDIAYSYVQYEGIELNYYTNNGGYAMQQRVITSLKTSAYGGFVNYGRQFILGNMLTMDYYVGVGFTGQSYSYTNPEYVKAMQSNYGYYTGRDISQVYNYHGFLRIPISGLSFTGGFRIGYIIPSKKSSQPHTKTN